MDDFDKKRNTNDEIGNFLHYFFIFHSENMNTSNTDNSETHFIPTNDSKRVRSFLSSLFLQDLHSSISLHKL